MNRRLFAAFASVVCAGIAAAQPSPAAPRTLVFFGDSLTAGYGLDDPDAEAFPSLIQRKIAAAALPWRVVNAGLSGETSAGGLRRVDWVLRQPADIFVLELGANDGLRGVTPAVTRTNLEAIIDRVRAQAPAARIVLAGMRMPPNLGEDYAEAFAEIFPEVAAKKRVALIPFLLEGVGGRSDLNQGDGMHPTAAGDVIVANTVWRVLQPLLTPPGRGP
jgi:acyl-CoA thioesterase-1